MPEWIGMSARRCVLRLAQELERAGIADSVSDARLLLFHVLQTDLTGLWTREWILTPQQAERLQQLLERRLKGEPVAYLTGKAWFMGLELSVSPDCLIPRFDTEIVAQTALERAPQGGRVADLCTGSGCIALALKHQRPDLTVCAYDISPQACAIARANACDLALEIGVACGDLFSPMEGLYDVIVSNPPYIPRGDMDGLMREVQFEPKLALVAGEDGLDLYRRIVPGARSYLKEGGSLVLEVGDGEAQAVSALLQDAGYCEITVKNDMAGLPRMVAGRWRTANA